jgi:PAS domain S-box-containing protein
MNRRFESTPTLTDLQASLTTIEENLARSRRQLAEAQQLSRIGSWECDIAAGHVWWSDELYRIYGLEPGAIKPTYQGFLEFVHPDDRESVDQRNRRAFTDHQPFEDVKRVVRDDGREIRMRTQGEVICDDDDRPMRMVGVCEDVTTTNVGDRARAVQIEDEVVQPLAEAGVQLARGEIDAAAATIEQARRSAREIAQALAT